MKCFQKTSDTERSLQDRYLLYWMRNRRLTVFQVRKKTTVYREIFASVLFSPISPSLSASKYKTGRIAMSQIIPLIRTQLCLGESRCEAVCNRKRSKITCGENIPVYSIKKEDKSTIFRQECCRWNVGAHFLPLRKFNNKVWRINMEIIQLLQNAVRAQKDSLCYFL